MSTISTATTGLGRSQSAREEFANALSHGIAALASLSALPFLVEAARLGGRAPWPYAIFGLSLVALFTASATYHAATSPGRKGRLRALDHSSIYVLIAGSYSAYSMSLLGGPKGLTLFVLEWAIAALGVALSLGAARRAGPKGVAGTGLAGALVYVAMGWLIAPFWNDMRAVLPYPSFVLLIAGGCAYTIGVAFYALKRVPWFHVAWHFLVIAGAACHVASLLIAAR